MQQFLKNQFILHNKDLDNETCLISHYLLICNDITPDSGRIIHAATYPIKLQDWITITEIECKPVHLEVLIQI
jgi:hypothetical protein